MHSRVGFNTPFAHTAALERARRIRIPVIAPPWLRVSGTRSHGYADAVLTGHPNRLPRSVFFLVRFHSRRRALSIGAPVLLDEQTKSPICFAGRLALSDSRSGVERWLVGEIPELAADAKQLLAVELDGALAAGSFAALAATAGTGGNAFESALLSTTKDGKSAELRIDTRSTSVAMSLLGQIEPALREVREHPRTARLPGADRVTVEASGDSVVVRAQAPLSRLLALLARVGRKEAPRSSDGHHRARPPEVPPPRTQRHVEFRAIIGSSGKHEANSAAFARFGRTRGAPPNPPPWTRTSSFPSSRSSLSSRSP